MGMGWMMWGSFGKVSRWDPTWISLVVWFEFSSLNFSVKIYSRKNKIHYKWDIDGIPLDTYLWDGPMW
jgi:hypothetical protein